MNWVLLTLLAVFVVSLAGILQKVLMSDEKSNPYSYAAVLHLLRALFNGVFALLTGGFQMPSISVNLAPFLISAILWGGASIFMFKALKLIEASEMTILSSTRVIFTIIVSVVFLRESFTSLNILGTVLILSSIFLVTFVKRGVKLNKGTIYALLMALFSGLAIVVDSYNVKNYDPVSYNAIVNLLIGFMILIAYPKTLLQWREFTEISLLRKILLLVVLSSVQAIAVLHALAISGNTAQIGTIMQASVIVTLILAIILLKEKDNLVRKLIAAVLVTLGVILLS